MNKFIFVLLFVFNFFFQKESFSQVIPQNIQITQDATYLGVSWDNTIPNVSGVLINGVPYCGLGTGIGCNYFSLSGERLENRVIGINCFCSYRVGETITVTVRSYKNYPPDFSFIDTNKNFVLQYPIKKGKK